MTNEVEGIFARAREAQSCYESGGSQELYDRAALSVGWALMESGRNEELSRLAVEMTGLGRVEDKVTKNHRKTLGVLRDIRGVRTYGVIEEDEVFGVTKIGRPMGVVGAVVPSTNPVATPVNNTINALKCGNAIVLSPSPKGEYVCERMLSYVYDEFEKVGLSSDLVQMLPPPGDKEKTQKLMELSDLVVVTGSQNNVRRAYRCGTPAIGVGAGNVCVIVDETADLVSAAGKIGASKCFDNATSCSSENALIVVEEIYDDFVEALRGVGGAVLSREWEERVVEGLWEGGVLSRDVIAKDAGVVIASLGLEGEVSVDTEFVCVETEGVGKGYPLSGEKLSRVLALYRVRDFEEACRKAKDLLCHHGAGHSVGIHSVDGGRALRLGMELPTCRVIVNQGHSFATGGSFTNGMPFSLSMGCGSWGGNSIDENLHWKHFLNVTRVVREIPEREPPLDEIFGGYWEEVGR